MTRWRRLAAPRPDARSRRGRGSAGATAPADADRPPSVAGDTDAPPASLATDLPDALMSSEAQAPDAARDDGDDQERVSADAIGSPARVSIQGPSTGRKGPLSE